MLLSLSAYSQYCVSFPIGLSHDVVELKAPSDYFMGTNQYRVVSFEIKAEGHPTYLSLGNNLNTTGIVEYLSKACPDGCTFLIVEMTVVDQKGQTTYLGGMEGPFPYMKFFEPKKNK